MDLASVRAIVSELGGRSGFALLDSETFPSRGVKKFTTGEKVILFDRPRYEGMVRNRLIKEGKNPLNFTSGELAWGERVGDSPLITHNGKYYLQTVLSSPGQSFYYIGSVPVDPAAMGLERLTKTNQGLNDDVAVRTYNIENITKLELL